MVLAPNSIMAAKASDRAIQAWLQPLQEHAILPCWRPADQI